MVTQAPGTRLQHTRRHARDNASLCPYCCTHRCGGCDLSRRQGAAPVWVPLLTEPAILFLPLAGILQLPPVCRATHMNDSETAPDAACWFWAMSSTRHPARSMCLCVNWAHLPRQRLWHTLGQPQTLTTWSSSPAQAAATSASLLLRVRGLLGPQSCESETVETRRRSCWHDPVGCNEMLGVTAVMCPIHTTPTATRTCFKPVWPAQANPACSIFFHCDGHVAPRGEQENPRRQPVFSSLNHRRGIWC